MVRGLDRRAACARLAARLWDVTEGTIRVGGVDIHTVDPEVLLWPLKETAQNPPAAGTPRRGRVSTVLSHFP